MKWTSTKDELPEQYKEVLILVDWHRGTLWRNTYPLVAYLNGNNNWLEERHDDSNIDDNAVTHWAEIEYPIDEE